MDQRDRLAVIRHRAKVLAGVQDEPQNPYLKGTPEYQAFEDGVDDHLMNGDGDEGRLL